MECLHIDGDSTNNNLLNLKWGTRSENQKMRVYYGGRKVSVEDIRFIQQHGHDYHGVQRDFAELFRVSRAIIANIVTERSYGYLT